MSSPLVARILPDHARFPAVLAALVPLEDEAVLRTRPAPARWSPLEVLVHLLDEEREDFRARAQAAIAGATEFVKIDPAGWVAARRYNEQDPRRVLESFTAERAASIAWLRTVTDADLARSVPHPTRPPLRAGDIIAAWRVHDLLHLRQLATALTHAAERDLRAWSIGYAGDIPPLASADHSTA